MTMIAVTAKTTFYQKDKDHPEGRLIFAGESFQMDKRKAERLNEKQIKLNLEPPLSFDGDGQAAKTSQRYAAILAKHLGSGGTLADAQVADLRKIAKEIGLDLAVKASPAEHRKAIADALADA